MSQQQREFSLDRYVRNRLMAEGVTVHAKTEAEAREKARALYSDDPSVHETRFQLRSDTSPTSQAEPFKRPTLYATCFICADQNEEAPCHHISDLRLTPDGDWYCEGCWIDSPYNLDGAWEKAPTLQARLNSASPAAGDWVMVPRAKINQLCEIAHRAFHVLDDSDQDEIRRASLPHSVDGLEMALNAFTGEEAADIHDSLDDLRTKLAAALQPPSGEREALEKAIAEARRKGFEAAAMQMERAQAAEKTLREIHKLAVHRGTFASVDTRMEHAEHALTRIAEFSRLPEERKP